VPERVRERDLAALLGVPPRQLRTLLGRLQPATQVGSQRYFRWRDVQPHLSSEQLALARKRARALRLQATHGSKYWVAGYPKLVAEWHPTRNADLFPDEVSYGSGRRVWWKCPKGPDHEWRAAVHNRVRGARCPFCTNQRVSVTNSLATRRPELAAQWHPIRNGALTPARVLPGTKRKVWWICPQGPDHEWRASVGNRARRGCPFCSGRRVSVTNNLARCHPHIAAQWHPTRNRPRTPDRVLAGTTAFAWWKCPHGPDHEWRTMIHSRTCRDQRCPFCAGQRVSQTNSLAARRPDLARQWHPTRNGRLAASDVTVGSKRMVWWRCSVSAEHVWRAYIKNRTAKKPTGCPFCRGKKASTTNSLATRAPDIARQWHPTRNGKLTPHDVTYGSTLKVWWLCPVRRTHVWRVSVNSRTSFRTGCPNCRYMRHRR